MSPCWHHPTNNCKEPQSGTCGRGGDHNQKQGRETPKFTDIVNYCLPKSTTCSLFCGFNQMKLCFLIWYNTFWLLYLIFCFLVIGTFKVLFLPVYLGVPFPCFWLCPPSPFHRFHFVVLCSPCSGFLHLFLMHSQWSVSSGRWQFLVTLHSTSY